MSDFQFLFNPYVSQWVVSAPRRAKRPNEEKGETNNEICPFCPGHEKDEAELFRIGGRGNDNNWHVRVIPNKYPFASIHEVIISSPDHHKGLDELPLSQLLDIFVTYRQRFNAHKKEGYVYIFHNSGAKAGESILHPHTQLAVIPYTVPDRIPSLKHDVVEERFDIGDFQIFCPKASQWPDEVWITPKKQDELFGEIQDEQLGMLAKAMQVLIKIFTLRHGEEFPYNFYIYPREDWYLRLIPRLKVLGGFEVGTGIIVNTQDPAETIAFIKEHFHEMDQEKIKNEQKAGYETHV